MPPLRRYLRLTPSLVLEVRIYSTTPGPWLLSPPTRLASVLAAVRPLILPKLREEGERSRGGGKGRGKGKARGKGVKDVVVGDGFEASVFLTETSTRHAVLRRRKIFREPRGARGTSKAADVGFAGSTATAILLREESDEEEDVVIQDVPAAANDVLDDDDDAPPARRSKRTRAATMPEEVEEEDTLFVPSASNSPSPHDDNPATKRARQDTTTGVGVALEEDEEEDKKKMGMRSEYDGFAINGQVLCLVVTKMAGKGSVGGGAGEGGKGMMEEWIASTQNPAGSADSE